MINSDEEYAPAYRNPSHYNPLYTFKLPSGQEKHYQQQYGDMYFLRLARLKPAAEQVAAETWDGFSVCAYTRLGDRVHVSDNWERLQGSVRVVWNECWT